ncbi:hypothetical protein J132_00769 [Termitomyces sp. J132]|nr:hypothetical protein H2248_009362 [Termitomyces sp. 'cryptogamus']KNZ78406.1 hypothetical protein J132_00769 [Termitomyces sp. J132]
MAFRDPYDQVPARPHHQPSYGESTADFNPYAPHQMYDQGGIGQSYDADGTGYNDESQYANYYPPNRSQSQRAANVAFGQEFKENTLEAGGFRQKTPRALRNYRYESQGNLWTRGGRGWCLGRFFCCTLMSAVLLFVCIILSLALWIRPPDVVIGGVDTVSTSGSVLQLIDNGIAINLGVNISVNNPNYFAVDFKEIKADIFYPINNTQVGEGDAKNVVFKANQLTNWTFPFTITYKTTDDPQGRIIQDLGSKCGATGPKSNIDVTYTITLAIRILIITVSPVFSNKLSFPCPIDASDLEPFLKGFGR